MPGTPCRSMIIQRPRGAVGPLSLMTLASLVMSISLLNLLVLRKDFQLQHRSSVENKDGNRLREVDVMQRELMEASQKQDPDIHSNSKSPRTLVGIFSRDDEAGATHRQHYRHAIEKKKSKLNGRQICSLPQFWKRRKRLRDQECMLVYTFVVGAHRPEDTTVPTEIDFTEQKREILVDHIPSPHSSDVNMPDVTRLNIRENDNEGKTQTFLYFAYRDVMGNGDVGGLDSPLLEYCMKVSPNTFFSLDGFLQFALGELHPAPYHRGVMAGVLRDKAYGMSSSADDGPVTESIQPLTKDLPRLESFWGNEFDGVHLYLSGQLYILSYDVIKFVLAEVPFSRERVAPGGYVVGYEGHDISSMAFHSPTALQVITISKSQRFWTYPVKTDDEWKGLVDDEERAIGKTLHR